MMLDYIADMHELIASQHATIAHLKAEIVPHEIDVSRDECVRCGAHGLALTTLSRYVTSCRPTVRA